MDAKQINSISEFLLQAGTEYLVFDLGRRIEPLESQTFLNIENGLHIPPFPRQKHAWFGIVFWNKRASNQHYIWFIKLPIDEQGLVVTATRNHFLQIIVDALGQSIADDTENAKSLPDNPYSFVPSQSQLAQFNAKVRQQLSLPLSSSYEQVLAYIKAPSVVDWQTLPLQGIADLAASLQQQTEVAKTIEEGFTSYAVSFQQSFMEMCESVSIPPTIERHFLDAVITQNDINIAALRGLSSGNETSQIGNLLRKLLTRDTSVRLDILSVVAARHFQQLNDELLHLFFETVAKADDNENYNGELFIGFFSDLVQIPSLRTSVLSMLRKPERSEQLSVCIGKLFTQKKGQ